jgi:hypothetical protein
MVESFDLPLDDFPNVGNQKHLMDKGRFDYLDQLMSDHSTSEINRSIRQIEKQLEQFVADIMARSNVCPIKATFSIETKTTRRARVIWRNNAKNFNLPDLVQVINDLDIAQKSWYREALVEVKKLESIHRVLWNIFESTQDLIKIKRQLKDSMML